MKKARDMESSVWRNKFQSKGFPQRRDKERDKRPFQRDAGQQHKSSSRLDNDQLNDLRRKKLCFHCHDPWDPKNKCAAQGKAK